MTTEMVTSANVEALICAACNLSAMVELMETRFRLFDEADASRTYTDSWYQGHYAWNYDTDILRSMRRDSMLDVVTPHFYTYRNQGGIICNPMIREKIYHTIDHTVFQCDGSYNGRSPIKYVGHTASGLEGVPVARLLSADNTRASWDLFSEFDREVSLAITRAHADVDLSEMSILASIGELPETISWIKSIIDRIVGVTKVFRARKEVASVLRNLRSNASRRGLKGDIAILERYLATLKRRKANRQAKKSDLAFIDNITNLWLEYRYAIRPLYFDLQNAISALEKVIEDKRFIARGHEYSVGKSSSVLEVDLDRYKNTVAVRSQITMEESIRARAGCLYVCDSQISSLLDVLGVDQPLESLYELIPFSFMLDWIFSVGDLLHSWFKSSGLSILTSWVTLQVKRTQTNKILTAELNPDAKYSWPSQQFELGSSYSEVYLKWRKPNPGIPLLPRFDLKLDLSKIIDIGTIGRNIINGKIPEVAKRG